MLCLNELLDDRRTLVCVGPGGVGKTTVAAAIALHAARAGRRALVLTIDPARRLATALGTAGGARQRIALGDLAGQTSGTLDAEMLDTQQTLQELLLRYAGDEAARQRIAHHPLVRHLGDALSGAQTYLAMERVHRVAREGTHDLVVLDTPPSATVLDFLRAPQRMVNMLDSPILRGLPAFGAPDGLASGWLERLARFTGREIFVGLAELTADLAGMFEGFASRAREVAEGLRAPDCVFLVIGAPTELAVDEARFFRRWLEEGGFPFGGFVINGVQPTFGSPVKDLGALVGRLSTRPALAGATSEELFTLGRALAAAVAQAGKRAESEQRLLAALDRDASLEVRRLSHDVHDVAGLAELAAQLFR